MHHRSSRAGEPSPAVTLWMLMILTFVTGVVDAVGYLALDRVFVGNMTGNIVILGMALAGADNLPIVGPAIALGAFVVGAFVGGMFLRRRRKVWSTAVSGLLAAGALVLALNAVAFLVPAFADSPTLELVASTATAAVMGGQAAVARSLAVADVTTVVVTSTLTSFASESLVDQGLKGIWNRRLAAIVIILLGAFAGALLLQLGPAVPLLLAAVLTGVVVAIGHPLLHVPAPTAPIEENA